MRGRFITFEGIEGSGKTTVIHGVAMALQQRGLSICVTREPGGTAIGRQIRQWLLNSEMHLQDIRSELLLFTADRLEHVAGVIRPALARGEVVLCDRFVDSTWAYQVGGRGMDPSLVHAVVSLVDLSPDQTIVMDVTPEEGLRRAGKRGPLDRFEQEAIGFHQRVRQAYLEIASRESRVCVVDSMSLSPEACVAQVLAVI